MSLHSRKLLPSYIILRNKEDRDAEIPNGYSPCYICEEFILCMHSHQLIVCSKLAIEALDLGVEYVYG